MSMLNRLRMWANPGAHDNQTSGSGTRNRIRQSPVTKTTAGIHKRCWFQADDGTYYRNCSLVIDEMDAAIDNPSLFYSLRDEANKIYRHGVIEKSVLDPGDVVVEPVSFALGYPHIPELSRLLDNRDKP